MPQNQNAPEVPAVTDLRVIRSREALRHALLALLEEKPLEQIVVRDITTAARIGYATFYRHYPTKEALLDDLAREQVNRLVNLALPMMDSVNSLAAWATFCAYVNEHRRLWTTLLTGGAAGVIRQEFLRVSKKVAATRFGLDDSVRAELSVILAVSTMVEILAWWLGQARPLSVEEAAKILEQQVISPAVAKAKTRANRDARQQDKQR